MLSKDYILGFVEGEGCFSIGLSRYIDRKSRLGKWRCNVKSPHLIRVSPSFRITNIDANRVVLEEIRDSLGVGNIYCQHRGNRVKSIQNVAYFYTKNFAECLKVRDYFGALTFRTKKGKDFILWGKCLELMEQKKHLTKEGLLEICQLRDQMNYHPTKNKWTIEEIKRILEEKPLHQTAHFDQNQQKMIHNQSDFDLEKWLAPKQGNSKPNRFVAP